MSTTMKTLEQLSEMSSKIRTDLRELLASMEREGFTDIPLNSRVMAYENNIPVDAYIGHRRNFYA